MARAETAPYSASIALESTPEPLNPENPSQVALGPFIYAGGIWLTAPGSTRLHGVSDLRVWADGRLQAITDRGDLLEARVVLDSAGRLERLTDGQLTPLLDQQGRAMPDKQRADAEGLAVFPSGDRLVSFERDDRIWLYPAGGGVPRPVPMPETTFPTNRGMEALTVYPADGADAYLVGSEAGQIWLCRLATGCRETPPRSLPGEGFGLSSMTAYGQSGVALLYRAYDEKRGARATLRLFERGLAAGTAPVAEMTLATPLTRDNFEGVAMVERPGGYRIYLLSDDNFSSSQHTYLLAFDWDR